MNTDNRPHPVDVLLVAGDRDGSEGLVEAFERKAESATLHTVSSAAAACDVLFQRGEYTTAPVPDVAVVYLPPDECFELLETTKGDPETVTVPAIVVQDPESENDVKRCYELGANACLDRRNDWAELVTAIEAFWLTRTHLPPKK